MQTISLKTTAHSQALDISSRIRNTVAQSGVTEGWCEIFNPHTTAGLAINESADPAVMADILGTLDNLVPWRAGYRHAEGNSAAHVKSVLVGSSLRLPVQEGSISLGTWQGIFFMEFDGPRQRKVLVDIQGR